jgi:peptide methionine sulfoxide reductase MsrA
LLDVFWSAHDARIPAHSVQYRSAILYRTDDEREAAEASKARIEASAGPVSTAIEPLGHFHRAEPYHQKYRLRSRRDLMQEFRARFATDAEFVDSTVSARVNGWLDGYGSSHENASIGQRSA